MKTIRVSDETYDFLMETAHNLNTQDNRHTDTPIFRIYENRKIERGEGRGEYEERLDYEGAEVPATVQLFKPVVYKDGTDYCCLMGPDPQIGVFGCGETPEEAVEDWADDLEERLQKQDPDDEVAQYIRQRLNSKS